MRIIYKLTCGLLVGNNNYTLVFVKFCYPDIHYWESIMNIISIMTLRSLLVKVTDKRTS